MSSILWILLALILIVLAYKLYGKSGVKSVLLLAGLLLIKDAALHVLGKTAEFIVVGLFVILAIAIYVVRRSRQE
jgi:predicted membrane-bound dolichyl-phosphate-mannose-protein mannosyltransferase